MPVPRAGKLYGMCVSGERVFVADYGRHQVHVLELKDGPLPPSPTLTPTASHVASPMGTPSKEKPLAGSPPS